MPITPLDALDWNYTAPAIINVHFGESGVSVFDNTGELKGIFDSDGWSASEKAAAMSAFKAVSDVANVQFNYVDTLDEADFAMWASPDATDSYGVWDVGMEANGSLLTTQGIFDLDGMGVFNTSDSTWDAGGLSKGGFGYITLIHEIGHGMGLAHTHDNGGGSKIMKGVSFDFDDYGDFDLNQGVYTTMTYNDGWLTGPQSSTPSIGGDFGFQASMMALDIAVLQEKYGANTATGTGNNQYTMKVANAPGTYYESIWDGGGVDEILVESTGRDVFIDLRAATLDYSATGGGVVSYVHNIHGGFTIANGVVIENASGSRGDDTLAGNDAANTLDGGKGTDMLFGRSGNDTLIGGAHGDALNGGSGTDTASYENASTAVKANLADSSANSGDAFGDTFSSIENVFGSSKNDWFWGDAADNVINGHLGNDRIYGGDGNDLLIGHGGSDRLFGEAGDDELRGGSGGDFLTGGDGDDVVRGDGGADTLKGSSGRDDLYGGASGDSFSFTNVSQSNNGGRDDIMDFASNDVIDLSKIDAKIGTGGNQSFDFVGTSGFSGTAGELRYVTGANLGQGNTGALVMADIDGDGARDLVIGVADVTALDAGDFIL